MQTGLILAVPDLQDAVAVWRTVALPGVQLDVPPHLTLLYPWLPREPTEEDRRRVHEAICHLHPFTLSFGEVGTFPGFVWLRPEPLDPVLAVYSAVTGAFAETPPYEGEHADVIPHVTVATCDPEETAALAVQAADALADPQIPGLGTFRAQGVDVAMRRSEEEAFTVRRVASFG